MPVKSGGRSGAVETRFPDVKGPKQVDPKDRSQFTQPASKTPSKSPVKK